MVKPNLPVGAVFEDGGLYFEVQSVLPDGNYISKRIETPIEKDHEDKLQENDGEEAISEKDADESNSAEVPAENKVTRNVQRKTTRGRKK